MDSQEALAFINRLLAEKRKQVLNQLEEKLFLGIWADQTYSQIVAQTHHAYQYVREAGADLCKKITEDLGIRVSKKNFTNPIKYRYQQYSVQVSPFQEPIAELTNPAERDESQSLYLSQQNHNPFMPQNGRIENLQQFFGRKREIQWVF
ncbi:hypothetical protein [Nostoc sp.]|uniref:hypothetical protein n=1 Tax=Nostoc sp. TaxID=1180 RepID=UPI002FF4680F